MPSSSPLPSSFLVFVTGLPGTGKTTFAKALADELGAHHLNTDIIRKQMGLQGQYDEESKKRVYREMKERAAKALKEGERLILDGTFYKQQLRDAYRQLGAEHNAPVFFFRVDAPESVVKERVAQERKYSEADFDAYLKVKNAWEPLKGEFHSLQSGPLEHMLESALAYLYTQSLHS